MKWKHWLTAAPWRRAWKALNTTPAAIEEPKIPAGAFDSFEHAFSSRVNGCRRDCECGREFFDNYNSGYDWDAGELDRLAANPNATPLPYAVGTVEFEGGNYVFDCDCWKPRARRIIAFILGHDEAIAEFLREEKKRRQAAAQRAPVVE